MGGDRYGVIYAIICLLGVATLLPWNILITETEYFDVRAHVKPFAGRVADDLKAVMPVAFQIANFSALALFIRFQAWLTVDHQVFYPLCVTLVIVVSIAVVAAMPSLSGNILIITTLPGCAVLGVTSAVLAGGVYSMAAPYGPKYIQATMTGQALAGVAVALLSLITQAASHIQQQLPTPTDVSRPAFKYFIGSAAVVLAAILGYLYLRRRVRKSVSMTSELDEPLVIQSEHCDTRRHNVDVSRGGEGPVRGCTGGGQQSGSGEKGGHDVEARLMVNDGNGGAVHQRLSVRDLLQLLRGYCAVVIANFCVTLAVFPAVSSSICSQHNPAVQQPDKYGTCAATTPKGRFYGDLFIPFSFVLFNAGDVAGRLLTNVGSWGTRPPPFWVMMAYALLRVPLAVALLFCNVITPMHWRLTPLLRSDWWPMCLVTLLGTTNGHLGMVSLMHAPGALPSNQRFRCGPIMSFCVVTGCILGSMASCLLLELLQSHPL